MTDGRAMVMEMQVPKQWTMLLHPSIQYYRNPTFAATATQYPMQE